jgi:hypothetical protein
MKSAVRLREEYHNRLSALQYKRRKNKRDFVILALLMVYFMEYFVNNATAIMYLRAPFILKIKNIDNARGVVNAIDEALNGRGRLEESIKEFVKINGNVIDTYTPIIPQNGTKIISKGESGRLKELEEQATYTETNNEISHKVNAQMLMKKRKQWNTQRDSKVRKTTFHQAIDRETVPITDYFQVGIYKAQFPADSSLPPFDRYGCRCYLTYFN